MRIEVFSEKSSLAKAAAKKAATVIQDAVARHGIARIVAATGASQFEFLQELTGENLPWHKVEMFHLDEYLGIPETHPASFRKYLRERLIQKTGIVRYHLLDGTREPREMIADVTTEIRKAPIDLAFVGVGENGHLAFNDPPADFDSEEAYIVVELDEACRRQQLGEGWFHSLEDVPRRAISMTVRQILKSEEILCIVPDTRKAQAVATCFGRAVTPLAPASILRTHANAIVYLDQSSASLLTPEVVLAHQA
ncbi:MAG TPA: 6-phosphogluconolactonase [Terriglobales bacterium]|jgi:glucosamine-6-phosphate deaminase|nr:6-phosphogluconolactonase [Terriglobales bacterium]